MKRLFLFILVVGLGLSVHAQHQFKTGRLRMEIDGNGKIIQLVDLSGQENLVPEGNPGTLIRIKRGERELEPSSMKVRKNKLTFSFEEGIVLEVDVKENADYLRFELTKVVNPDKVEALFWGPFYNTIGDTIGEVVGVVREPGFALGLRALNPKTIGGKLLNEEGVVSASASIGGATATKEDFGSSMQAFCINQSLDRVIKVWHHHNNTPVPGLKDYALEGTAIAIFGTTPDKALATMGTINQEEGLPYQVIDGEWVRQSQITGKPYLITSFSEENFDELLGLAERLGFYSIYHEHPFETWGHFDLIEEQFPNGREGMKKCVEKAKAKNIRVGVHTLTNFITTNDPFVTTDANSGLMAAGISLLEEDIDANATEIVVSDDDYFAQVSTLNSVLIGNEIVRYQEVTKEKPYKLVNCVRGAFDTKPVAHKKGDEVKKLMDFPYKTLFPGWEMQKQLIQNMADFFNETGVSHMDFDGHEGACYTGRGDYATNYFADEFLKKVDHLVVNGSSNINHYYWNNNSYINWGEPWYASFRESQSEHRFRLQPFFERNYMPNMLGWFLVNEDTRVEDVEWMMSVAAGYDAGYALVVRYDSYKNNPNMDKIIETIVRWEEAKEMGVFSKDQRTKLKDPGSDFHLEKTGADQWDLQYFDKAGFEHHKQVLQPGQPTYSEWTFQNDLEGQPLHLRLLVTGENAVVEGLELEVDNFFRIDIPVSLKKGQSLVWDSSDQMKLYNEKGRFIKMVDIGKRLPVLKKGSHTITIDAGTMEGVEPVVKGTVKLKGKTETINL